MRDLGGLYLAIAVVLGSSTPLLIGAQVLLVLGPVALLLLARGLPSEAERASSGKGPGEGPT